MAFDWEPFPTEAVQFVAPVSPCSTGGALHGGHGFVASTVYAGGCGVFPRGKVRLVFSMYTLPPLRICAIRTFHVTFL